MRPRCVVRAQLETAGHVEAGVVVEWWLQQQRGEAIESFLRKCLGDGVELAECFGPHFRFRLQGSHGVGELFQRIEAEAAKLCIAEYTLTQATLEQIFNAIAREAEEEREAASIE